MNVADLEQVRKICYSETVRVTKNTSGIDGFVHYTYMYVYVESGLVCVCAL